MAESQEMRDYNNKISEGIETIEVKMEPIDNENESIRNSTMGKEMTISKDTDEIASISPEAENRCIFKCCYCNFITGCSKWLSCHANLHQIQDLAQFVHKVMKSDSMTVCTCTYYCTTHMAIRLQHLYVYNDSKGQELK